jgi:hypothetical protein
MIARIIHSSAVFMLALFGLQAAARSQQNPSFIDVMTNLDLTPQQSAALSSINSLLTTRSAQVITINPAILRDGNRLSVPFGGQTMTFAGDAARDSQGDRILSWSGVAADAAALRRFVKGSTSIAVNGNNITASIHTGAGLLRIRPLGNGLHALVDVDISRLPPEHPPSFNERNRNLKDMPPFEHKPETDTSVTPISVLVAYTPAVQRKVADVKGLVQLAFTEANQSYVNSKIFIRLAPAPDDPVLVNYMESGSMTADLDAFSKMDDIKQLRAASKSNVAVLLIDDGSACGLAKAILATHDNAFAVVYHDCATGYYSFGHEIGHLQGARHNPETDNQNSPFPYGHGFIDLVQKRRTVMSYDCPGGCTRMPQWARPPDWGNLTISFDAKVLNETAIYVSKF